MENSVWSFWSPTFGVEAGGVVELAQTEIKAMLIFSLEGNSTKAVLLLWQYWGRIKLKKNIFKMNEVYRKENTTRLVGPGWSELQNFRLNRFTDYISAKCYFSSAWPCIFKKSQVSKEMQPPNDSNLVIETSFSSVITSCESVLLKKKHPHISGFSPKHICSGLSTFQNWRRSSESYPISGPACATA